MMGLGPGYISGISNLKVWPTGFADGLNMGCKRKREVKDYSKAFGLSRCERYTQWYGRQ